MLAQDKWKERPLSVTCYGAGHNEAGLKAFETEAEPIEGRFPLRLGNHAAFHTHLQEPVAEQGRAALPGTTHHK
mgnify:CR=1 FL=1